MAVVAHGGGGGSGGVMGESPMGEIRWRCTEALMGAVRAKEVAAMWWRRRGQSWRKMAQVKGDEGAAVAAGRTPRWAGRRGRESS